MDDRNRGIYRKYFVSRVDGSTGVGEKHEHCFHFVIDVDHDPYASPALVAYAGACAEEYPKLADDLKKIATKVDNINNARCLLEEAVDNGKTPESLWTWFQEEKPTINSVITQFREEENGNENDETKSK